MPKLTQYAAGGKLLAQVVDYAMESESSVILSDEKARALTKIFDDADLVASCFALFENDLNVSRTAQKLYMHRNTLLYRIKKLKRLVGIDVTNFSDAVTFILAYRAYTYQSRRKT